MDFSVSLAGVELEHPLINAAGTCKVLEGGEGVEELARSATAAILVGSITVQPRSGNEGETYWSDGRFSLNSVGLANPGKEYYEKYLPKMKKISHDSGKPLFVSVAGFYPLEYAVLTEFSLQTGADLVELNLSCANVWQGKEQEKIICFDPELLAEVLYCVEREVGLEARVAVKLSPFSNPFALREIAQVIANSGLVKAVTAINTFPNVFSYDEKGRPRIGDGIRLPSLGGPALKPIGLGQVRQLRDMLPERIDIIGVGGISTGQDMIDYLRAGAKAVQVGTAFLDKHINVFSQLLSELLAIVDTDIN